MVTITTVGYGDISPDTPLAQTWAMVEMFVGIGLVGVITGKITSVLVERNRIGALGLMYPKNLNGHLIICGWKEDIADILVGLLDASPHLDSSDLVLVTVQQPAHVSDLKRNPRLKHLHYIAGSHTSRNIMANARVTTAERVIILAEDWDRSDSDHIDSRTVISATTIESLSKTVPTSAELIQPHFTPYLDLARVEQVIYIEDISRSIIIAASLGVGLSNVIYHLQTDSPSPLEVRPFPDRAQGKNWNDAAEVLQDRGELLLGIRDTVTAAVPYSHDQFDKAVSREDFQAAFDLFRSYEMNAASRPKYRPDPDKIIEKQNLAIVLHSHPHSQSEAEIAENKGISPVNRFAKREHLIVCGWKRNMDQLIEKILEVHRINGKPLGKLTVVSTMPEVEKQNIKKNPRLKSITLVEGKTTDPDALKKGGITRAHRVLILADQEAGITIKELDTRNVIASIAIERINPDIYKCVELNNPNYSTHLYMAGVEEVIFTRRYQLTQMVEIAQETPQAHILPDLIDPSHPFLRVVPFPEGKPGQTFGDYKKLFASSHQNLIGLVENTGNYISRRLSGSEESPDSVSAETILKQKYDRNNIPIFNPSEDYIPGSHARALVIHP